MVKTEPLWPVRRLCTKVSASAPRTSPTMIHRGENLMRTRLARSLADAALSEMGRQLRYKAEWAGRWFGEMPAFHRSTGVCPVSGKVGPKLPLSVRAWWCEGCAREHDRDVAAAQVILSGAVGRGTPEPASETRRKRGSAVDGGDVRRTSSHRGPPANGAEARATGSVP
jgi:putative transposase